MAKDSNVIKSQLRASSSAWVETKPSSAQAPWIEAQTRKRRRTSDMPATNDHNDNGGSGENEMQKQRLDQEKGPSSFSRRANELKDPAPSQMREDSNNTIVLPLEQASLPPNHYELLTTFEGSSGSYGVFFDVSVKELESDDTKLRIDSLDIHTSVQEPCPVFVYVLKEKQSYVGHEVNPLSWSLVTNATIQCEGFYRRTNVPLNSLVTDDRLTLKSGETTAFYIMMNDPRLRYTDSFSFGEVFSSTDHLNIYEGTGVGDWWGGIGGAYLYRPRIWNGSVRYEVVKPPGSYDQEPVIPIPPSDELCSKEITTPYVPSISSYGNMFNVRTKDNALTITGMSLCTDRLTTLNYEIYTKRDTFLDHGMVGLEHWKLIAQGDVTGLGSGVGTPIPAEHFLNDTNSLNARTIPANSIQGFYVTFHTNDMNYVKTSLNMEETMVTNDDIDVLVGVGVGQYPFKDTFYDSRMWRGQIEYDLHEACPPTEPPTLSPTTEPPVPATPSPTPQPTTPAPTWECSKQSSLLTTSAGGTSSYGNMFEVFAPYRDDQQALIIKTLDLFIQKAGENVEVLVYTKPGSFQGHELDKSAWTLICNTTVTSSLFGDFTSIPEYDFRDVRMVGPERRSFYVTLNTASLLYTKTEGGPTKTFSSDDFLQIFEGSGIGRYPLFGTDAKQLHTPRTWNGVIHYETEAACVSGGGIDIASTPPPTPAPMGDEDGVGFVSLNKLAVTRVNYLFNVEHDPIKVPLSFVLGDLDANVLKSLGTLLSSDKELEYHTKENALEIVSVSSNENDDIDTSYGCAPSEESNICSNVKAMITVTHKAALSSDGLTYELLRVREDVLAKLDNSFYDIKYVGEESVETRTEIVLNGVPAEAMGTDEAAFFEGAAKRFLNNAAGLISEANGSVKVLTVTIEQQQLKGDGEDISVFEGRSRPNGALKGGNRGLQTSSSSSSIGIVTTVTGQYQPPPEINFPDLVHDSIDAGEEDLRRELTSSDDGAGLTYFENIREIEVKRPPPTPSPTAEIDPAISSGTSSGITTVIIIICSAGAAIILGVVLFLCYRQREKAKEGHYRGIRKEMKKANSDRSGLTRGMSSRNSFSTNFTGITGFSHDEDALAMPQQAPQVRFANDEGTISNSTISTKPSMNRNHF